ncbi:MAG TPA: hypothetical protein VM869_26065 [Enhygromyxa sp.]|nr:hypothetical protein [Enhygromyxa sp.]
MLLDRSSRRLFERGSSRVEELRERESGRRGRDLDVREKKIAGSIADHRPMISTPS